MSIIDRGRLSGHAIIRKCGMRGGGKVKHVVRYVLNLDVSFFQRHVNIVYVLNINLPCFYKLPRKSYENGVSVSVSFLYTFRICCIFSLTYFSLVT